MIKLSTNEAELKKSVAYKKQVCMINFVTSHNLKIDCEVINSANGDMTLK